MLESLIGILGITLLLLLVVGISAYLVFGDRQ